MTRGSVLTQYTKSEADGHRDVPVETPDKKIKNFEMTDALPFKRNPGL